MSEWWLDGCLETDIVGQLERQVGEVADDGAKALRFARSPMVASAVRDALASGLHLDLLALFAEGWSLAAQLREYRDRTKYPPGTTALLKLGEHSIARELRPVVVIHAGKEFRKAIDIAIAIAGTFRGVELSIRDGAIVAVGSGSCDIEVQPKLSGVAAGKPRRLVDRRLPGYHAFTPPIAIPGR